MFFKLIFSKGNKEKPFRHTMLGMFNCIGESYMMDFIVTNMHVESKTYHHDKAMADIIRERYGLAQSSQFRYLSSMVKTGILKKLKNQRSIYHINLDICDYGYYEPDRTHSKRS